MTTDVQAGVDIQFGVADVDQPHLNEDFILDIDEAMKNKVNRVVWVTEEDGAKRRQVKAYFRWPQTEVTDQTFPFIVVDRMAMTRAADREQRSSDILIPYTPKGYTAPPTDEFLHTDEMPIPFDFVYQITLHSRFWLHDTRIAEQMFQDHLLPPRGGWLIVGDTYRPLFIDGPLDATGMDPQPGGRSKRHFRKVWTVTTSGELFQKDINFIDRATSITTTITPTE
jgi:hypothetical protein